MQTVRDGSWFLEQRSKTYIMATPLVLSVEGKRGKTGRWVVMESYQVEVGSVWIVGARPTSEQSK